MPNNQPQQDERTLKDMLFEFSADVKKLQADLNAFKRHPGAWDVMRYYLKGKGHQLNTIDEVLGGVEEFMSHFAPPKHGKKA